MSSSLESDSTTGVSTSTRNPPGPPTNQRCPQYQIPFKLSIAERLLGHGFGNAAHGSRISEREHRVDRGGREHAGQLQHQGLLEERLQGDEFSELLKFLKKKAGGSERGEGADYVGEKRDEDSESTDITILESVSGGDGRFGDAAEQQGATERSSLVEESLVKPMPVPLIAASSSKSTQEGMEKPHKSSMQNFAPASQSPATLPASKILLPSVRSTRASPRPFDSSNYPTARLRNQAIYAVYTQTTPLSAVQRAQTFLDSAFTLHQSALDRAEVLRLSLLPLGEKSKSLSSNVQRAQREGKSGGSVVEVYVQALTLNPEPWALKKRRSMDLGRHSEVVLSDFEPGPEESEGPTEKPSER